MRGCNALHCRVLGPDDSSYMRDFKRLADMGVDECGETSRLDLIRKDTGQLEDVLLTPVTPFLLILFRPGSGNITKGR